MKLTLHLKKHWSFSAFFIIFFATSLQLVAQTVNETATITWPFDLGTANQVAAYSGSATTADYFKPDYTSLGSNYTYNGSKTEAAQPGITYTSIKNPGGSNTPAGAVPGNLLSFNITPVTGLNFLPTSIAFNCQRFGTGSGRFDLYWKSSDGTSKLIQADVMPARQGADGVNSVNIDLTTLALPAIPSSNGLCSLEIYIHSLGGGKDVGISNVQIIGSLTGTVATVTTYTITTSNLPVNAGSIESFPVGSIQDEGTEITLTATRNFGYQFSHWADGLDQQVSTENPYTFTLNSDVELKAVYSIINTYSLDLTVNGGAADYMVAISPAGTIDNGTRLYEEGTGVILTASNNPILNFLNYGTGETNAELNVVMDGNKNITAEYNALDYIVGWDFYKSGSNGRLADFSSDVVNEASALILRQADGTQGSWLDKSSSSGGYEGRNAAVNWRPIADKYYYQISFNATDYTDISVQASMLYNYNAYAKQLCEYSIDGTNFTQIGFIDLVNAKIYYDGIFTLPIEANNASTVYIRWIPDYNSSIIGAASPNDGTTISGIYVYGTESVFNDGTAPVLASSVPANNATGASATGKVVLNFDERVKIAENTTATLNGKQLTPVVFGKSISFNYSGLDYNTTYTFDLVGNVISDLSDNTLIDAISISFTTLDKPIVTKRAYDFIVGVDGDFAAALAAADAAKNSGNRFYIFFPNGDYDLGTTTGDATQQTFISLPNISFIGQSTEGVTLYNNPTQAQEGIDKTPTINFTSSANNIYMQDLTLLNKMDYRLGIPEKRAVALRHQGDKNIFKNIRLLSNQDTYYTSAGRTYWENGEIHGTVDYIFGDGDIFFNECLMYMENRASGGGGIVTAAATSSNWGYVFSNCTIDGDAQQNGIYGLGRPWNNAPKVVYINTTMNILPSAGAWGDPMNVVPFRFAEYNSLTSSGIEVDLSQRRTDYTKDATSVTLDPTLDEAEAAQYTIENVLSGGDTWQPTLFTEQASTPVISKSGSTINWDNDDYVLGWAVFKDDIFVDFVITNAYVIPGGSSIGIYTIRAANAMGGLGLSSNQVDISLGIKENNLLGIKVYPNPVIDDEVFISIPFVSSNTTMALFGLDGRLIMKGSIQSNKTTINMSRIPSGVYLLKVDSEKGTQVSKIIKK